MNHPVATLKDEQDQIKKLTDIERSPNQIKAVLKRFNLHCRKVKQITTLAHIEQQNIFKNNKLERLLKLLGGHRIKLFLICAAHLVH